VQESGKLDVSGHESGPRAGYRKRVPILRSKTADVQFAETACYVHNEVSSATLTTSQQRRLHSQVDGRLPGLIVVCFGGFWVRGLPFPNARHLGHPFHWKNTLP
jgi:hypothetical protein